MTLISGERLYRRFDRTIPALRWAVRVFVVLIVVLGVGDHVQLVGSAPVRTGVVSGFDGAGSSITVTLVGDGPAGIVSVRGTERGLGIGDHVDVVREGARWVLVSLELVGADPRHCDCYGGTI